jgi:heme a synthase
MSVPSTQPPASPWLHRFAVFTAVATLVLVVAGGLVTSHGAGMAVPDWPNTYDYNLFFFPISHWVGGIFYEHTHRLLASGVGLLTSMLALWLYGRSARPLMRWIGLGLLVLGVGTVAAAHKRWTDGLVLGTTGLVMFGASFAWPACQASPRWLRRLGVVAFLAVVLQGVLGGLRVVLHQDQLGIFHATLAQLFFVLLCAIALFTSRWWTGPKAEGRGPKEVRNPKSEAPMAAGARPSDFGLHSDFGLRPSNLCSPRPSDFRSLRAFFLLPTLLILGQLILGATMRHQHAGLAIPDFPLAYGKVWPATDAAAVAHYNAQRIEAAGENPITAAQIVLQMAHRGMAVLILMGVGTAAWLARRRLGGRHGLSRLALSWLALLLVQVLLGAATIWSGKAADIATAHVLVGAVSLALGALLSISAFREVAFEGRGLQAASLPASSLAPELSSGLGTSTVKRPKGRAPIAAPGGAPSTATSMD